MNDRFAEQIENHFSASSHYWRMMKRFRVASMAMLFVMGYFAAVSAVSLIGDDPEAKMAAALFAASAGIHVLFSRLAVICGRAAITEAQKATKVLLRLKRLLDLRGPQACDQCEEICTVCKKHEAGGTNE